MRISICSFFDFRAAFSWQVLFKWIFLYEKQPKIVQWGLSGNRLEIPFIRNKPLEKKRTPETVRLSFLAFSKNELIFRRQFCSKVYFSTKRDQKLFFDGFLETACVYLSSKVNRLKNYWELQKGCASQFLLFWFPSRFFVASFVQMNVSLRKTIQNCSLRGLSKTARKYLSFKTNRLKNYWELQKWCALQFLLFWNASRFFSASFVQMKTSLPEGIRNCSLMVLRKALW